MKNFRIFTFILFTAIVFIACEKEKDKTDFSGIYCLNIQNMEMTITQIGNDVTFTVQHDLLVNGTGKVTGDTLVLKANASGSEVFTCSLTSSDAGQSFSGLFQVADSNEKITIEGILYGDKGECATYDIDTKGIPKFIGKDFTQLSKIEMISKFRSGFGHSYTDNFETCRSMKHYYNPYEIYRENNIVEIYSPVNGTIVSVLNDYEGAFVGLKNKEIQIRPDDQPAFICDIFHCDLVSSAIETGKKVQAGELLGYACMYYETWEEYVTSFDIAVWVNTPSGIRLVSYFDTMKDVVFNNYISRGALSRQDFSITKEARDADPLECDEETFVSGGNINNWVTLN